MHDPVTASEIEALLVLRERLPAGGWTTNGVAVQVGGHPVAQSGSSAGAAYLATAGDLAPRLAAQLREVAADALRLLMQHLSLKYTQEPWAEGLARALWRAVQDGPVRLDEDEVAQLDLLADVAGGWYADPDEFLPLEAWKERYEEA